MRSLLPTFCSNDPKASSWLHLFTFTSVTSLIRLLLYAILDLYWALYQHSWPLTLCFYLPFCIPLELAFYLQVQRFLRERSRTPNMIFGGEPDVYEAQRAWEALVQEEPPHVVDESLRGWFVGRGAPKSHDVLDLITLTTFNKPAEQLRPDQLNWARAMLEECERTIGRRFAPGRNHKLRSMAFFGLEGLEPCWKPLLFYLCTQTCQGMCHLILRYLGYERREAGALKYWYRPALPEPLGNVATRASRRVMEWSGLQPAAPPPPQLPPLVILHGVGGLAPYWLLLVLASRQHRGAIILPLFPHCSLSCLPVLASAPRPPTPTELASSIREMVYACGFRQAAFLSHSFGTAALGALLKTAPDLALAATFVDPICFCFSGTVAHNFLYAKPPAPVKPPSVLRRGASAPAALRRGASPSAIGEADGGFAAVDDGASSDDADEDFDDAASLASAASATSVASNVSWTHYAQRKIATEEPTIQDAFRRRFWWAQNWLHPSDLPCDAHVILSGLDTVASANEVRRHLKDYNQKVQREAMTSPNSVTSAGRVGAPVMTGGFGRAGRPSSPQGSPLITVEYHATWRHGWLLMHPHCLRTTIATLTASAEHSAPSPPMTTSPPPLSSATSFSYSFIPSPFSPLRLPASSASSDSGGSSGRSSSLRRSSWGGAASPGDAAERPRASFSPAVFAREDTAPSSGATAASRSTPAHRSSRTRGVSPADSSPVGSSLAVEFATTWGTCGGIIGSMESATGVGGASVGSSSHKAKWLAEAEAGSRRAATRHRLASGREKETCCAMDDEASETASIVSSILTAETSYCYNEQLLG